MQKAPEKKLGMQLPSQFGGGAGVVVISRVIQHLPPLAQNLLSSISSHNMLYMNVKHVPGQSSMGGSVVGAGVVVVVVLVEVVLVVVGGTIGAAAVVATTVRVS